VDWLAALLGSDEFVRAGKMGSGNVEGIHGRQAGDFRFTLGNGRYLRYISDPFRLAEILFVESTLQMLPVKEWLGRDLEVEERARDKGSVRVLNDGESKLTVCCRASESSNQNTGIEKAPAHRSVG